MEVKMGYEFKLTPAFCLYNGAAVLEQNGASVKVLIDNDNDEIKGRLERAFSNHVSYVLKRNDCPSEYKSFPKIEFVRGNRNQLRKCVSNLYGKKNELIESGAVIDDKVNGNEKSWSKKSGTTVGNFKKEDSAAVLLLDSILLEAREQKATDIHIESNKVRFRVNGQLGLHMELDSNRCDELIQRIKLLADMNVLEKRKSQDGHFVYSWENPIFLRVSTVGVIGDGYSGGLESVVLRLLDTSRVPLALEKLGFNRKQLGLMKKFCGAKNGLVITCGPTGAGKSTTNASLLMEIQREKLGKLKIVSLEDPPEYVIPGVTQIQIDEKQGRSFDDALKHVFRQDPDVLMIGEIRDEFTAQTAIRASLTGHLVFATLHASTAEEVILRLMDLKIDEKLLCSVLKGVIAQDLNHFENQVNLMADVAVFNGNKNGFVHCTNYSDVVVNSIREMYNFRKQNVHLGNGVG